MNSEFQFEEGEVLLIDKPLEWTSFDVVNKIRHEISRKLGKKIKVGHAGTLDPLATGLLIICTGKMTKQIDLLQAKDKEYTGAFYLGKTTPSYDAETEPDADFPIEHLTETLIQDATHLFLGEILQYPPMFSAIKVQGKKLYELARKGKSIEVQARQIEIREFEISQVNLPQVRFRVHCSKGTYIRSLAHDFGKALNSGAYLAELKRTKIGEFDIQKAYSLEALIAKIREM
jgi:tRNA pseudouridine55 synthase